MWAFRGSYSELIFGFVQFGIVRVTRHCKFSLVLKSKIPRLHCGGFQTATERISVIFAVVCVTFRPQNEYFLGLIGVQEFFFIKFSFARIFFWYSTPRVFALSGYGVKTLFILLVPIYIVGTSEPAEFWLIGVIHGIAEVIERSTMVFKDHLYNQVLERRKIPWGGFRTPRRERLATDICIMNMLYESSAVISVNGFLCLY